MQLINELALKRIHLMKAFRQAQSHEERFTLKKKLARCEQVMTHLIREEEKKKDASKVKKAT